MSKRLLALFNTMSIVAIAIAAPNLVRFQGHKTLYMVYNILLYLGGVGFIITEVLKAPKSVKKQPDEISDPLLDEYISKVFEYCRGLGLNVTLMPDNGDLWLVEVDDTTGATKKLFNFALPESQSLNKKSLASLIALTCEQIDEIIKK